MGMHHNRVTHWVCRVCGQLQRAETLRPGTHAECVRCGAFLGRSPKGGLVWTAALSLAALILFVPANVYPILKMDMYGALSESTIWDGCVKLFQGEQWPIAIIVFLASILIPLLKLLGLLYLVSTTWLQVDHHRRERTWVCRAISLIGPWAMLDVFLVSVLVGLVKLGQLATVRPGPGLVAFTAMVVLTILASSSFDSRWIWEKGKACYD
jgi:paraquat-inducible protein A